MMKVATLGMMLVGFFAAYHGYAHGREMPVWAGAMWLSLGFVLATILLHGAGLSAGMFLQQRK
ncbi:MAG TPA: HupE/UreJ family protein [Terriglobales bacterium]|nr:HupE/UreJ family protein [Terriglobales bacterium]